MAASFDLSNVYTVPGMVGNIRICLTVPWLPSRQIVRLYLNPPSSNAFDITAAGALGRARCSGLGDHRRDDREGNGRGRVGDDSEIRVMRLRNALGFGGATWIQGRGATIVP